MKIKLLAFALVLSATSLHAQEPKRIIPEHRIHFDAGWFTRAHALSAGYDGATTALVMQNPRAREIDPIAKTFLGSRPGATRLIAFGGLEVTATALIPNKKVRRIAQIALITTHIVCGTKNFRNVR